jgi:predicted nucleic acid-binding protein
VPQHYVVTRDPDDSKYVNLAITAVAPYIVTDDFDLLDLMDPQSAAGIDFQARFPHVQIVTPLAFEAIIAKASP